MAADKSRELRIEIAKGPGDLCSVMAIREVVFIEEQSVPEDLERDEDDAHAFHLLAYQGGHAVGTGRLVTLLEPPEGEQGSWGRIGRMAIVAAHRRAGIGTRLLAALEEEARRRELDGLMLHAQQYVRDFYRRAGYSEVGEGFEEAGMPHIEMRKRFAPARRG